MKNLSTSIKITLIVAFAFQSMASFSQKKGKLTPEEKAKIKTATTVQMYWYEAPPLFFMTPKDAAGEGLMAKVTKSDLSDSSTRYRYYPNKLLQQQVDSLFKTEGLIENLTTEEQPFEFQMPAELKDLSKYDGVEADYIIELIVPLMAWRAWYAPANWKKYTVGLGAEVRIYRASDMTRVWKGNVGNSKDERLKFHISELEENGKEKITVMRNIAVISCAQAIIEEYKAAKK